MGDTMDWKDIAGLVGGLAPALGGALGGPFGAAAGKVLGDVLGTVATPEAVNEAISKADPATLPGQLASADAAWVEAVKAMAETVKVQSAEVGQTIRAEIAAGVSWWHWRHLLGYVVGGWVGGVAIASTKHIWFADGPAIAALVPLLNSVWAYFGAAAGLLGYIAMDTTRRTTAAAAGEAVPTILGGLIKAVTKGK